MHVTKHTQAARALWPTIATSREDLVDVGAVWRCEKQYFQLHPTQQHRKSSHFPLLKATSTRDGETASLQIPVINSISGWDFYNIQEDLAQLVALPTRSVVLSSALYGE
jgi:hypothetical protein